jgi:hypothetical protein
MLINANKAHLGKAKVIDEALKRLTPRMSESDA